MFPYIPNTKDDEKTMLGLLGKDSIDELFEDIPKSIRLNRSLDLGPPLSEIEVREKIVNMARKNRTAQELTCFLGAGAYDHYIPSIVPHLVFRSEFYTSYTPYQAEINQGTLQAIFEYQTMIADLTGMDISNASLYDGASATAEAALIALDKQKGDTIIVSKTVHPETRQVLKTYMDVKGVKVKEIDIKDGVTDLEHLKDLVDKDCLGIIVQNPNFFGIIEDCSEVADIAKENKALMIMNVDPISLGILKTPGEYGADIAVGEGQSLGNSLNFGGPYLGFMAVKKALMRKMPGRIVGQSEDREGNRGFTLTLQAREQHIRREKAISNICSNQSLNALTATIYMATLGKKGLKEVALQSSQKAHYTYNQLLKTGKFKKVFDKPFFKEFVLETTMDVDKLNERLLEKGIIGGYNLVKSYPERKNQVLFCVTEKRTKEEIDNLVKVLEEIL
ncbi:MAG TPA: aminomethyl-transferring glycine dehydrogenase subunit GcvPA [Eubacteriaceae bacterium]|jgi:glycine dehydrogenase subunit 1|nr:aminomethyl-transferring glycine dehydrogenase subunit GcvPA [Eubacteriaceae bacterium]